MTKCTSITGRTDAAARAAGIAAGVVLLVTAAGCALVRGPSANADTTTFTATAYCVTGTTALGMQTRPGIVAADPVVLPLGTRIRVSGAGRYSGVYTVADTGRAVRGRQIDIFMSDLAAAKRFGRRHVRVEVLGDARTPR